MKEVVGFLCGAMGMLLLATVTLVLMPAELIPSNPEPVVLSPEVLRGREQYVGLGCVYCHSQQPRPVSVSPADEAWGWGRPEDPSFYTGQDPHLLGTMRTGPDLLHIADRQPSRQWHLLHLYDPREVVPESIMPSYPFLFTPVAQPTERSITLQNGTHLEPTEEGEELLAYLLSLKESTK